MAKRYHDPAILCRGEPSKDNGPAYLIPYLHMKLTPAQQTQVKKILAEYKHEMNSILKTHRIEVTKLVKDLEKKKTDAIKRLIASV